MKCPYKFVEDTGSETFNEWNHECQKCRHFEECKHSETGDKGYDNVPGDNHLSIPKCIQAEHIEVLRDFSDRPKITREEVADMCMDLYTMTTSDIIRECVRENKLKKMRRTK